MRLIQEGWEEFNKQLDTVDVSNGIDFLEKDTRLRRVFVLPIEESDKMFNLEINSLLENFDDITSVVEIGAGFGNFCKILSARTDIDRYVILDTPSMLRLSKKFLSHHSVPCEFVDVEDFETLFDQNFDLFVANTCLSEFPEDYRNNLLENILPKCNRAYIKDEAEWVQEKLTQYFIETKKLETQFRHWNKKQKVTIGFNPKKHLVYI